jgi:hypothetical protein
LPQIAVNAKSKVSISIYVCFCDIFLHCRFHPTTIALGLLYVEEEGLEESHRGLIETSCD